MTSNVPEKQIYENQKLVSDGNVDLYEFVLSIDGETFYLRLKENNSVDWNSKRWQGIPLSFEGWQNSSLTSPKRPMFTCANPNGVFSGYIRNGALVNATMNRYRVLYDDILNNRSVYLLQKWRVWQIKSFTNLSIVLELRTPMDGFNVKLPPRTYQPPEFPVVSFK